MTSKTIDRYTLRMHLISYWNSCLPFFYTILWRLQGLNKSFYTLFDNFNVFVLYVGQCFKAGVQRNTQHWPKLSTETIRPIKTGCWWQGSFWQRTSLGGQLSVQWNQGINCCFILASNININILYLHKQYFNKQYTIFLLLIFGKNHGTLQARSWHLILSGSILKEELVISSLFQ